MFQREPIKNIFCQRSVLIFFIILTILVYGFFSLHFSTLSDESHPKGSRQGRTILCIQVPMNDMPSPIKKA
jgi:hypothetical protein